MQMLSGKDLAKLHLDLEAPQLLASALLKDSHLAGADECALRRAYAELSPVETLIAIACSFHVIAPHLGNDRDMIAPLLSHADEILDDYASHWMSHSMPHTSEWTSFIHEDLETLGDFLTILSDAATGLHPALEDIFEILNEQAFLKSLAPMAFPANADNVIRFPIERRH